MKTIFDPAVSLLNRLKFPFKFGLIGGLFVLLVGVLLFQFIEQINLTIDFGTKERLGIEYNKPVRLLLESLYEYRSALGENMSGKEVLNARETEIGKYLKDIQDINAKSEKELDTAENVKTISRQWEDIMTKGAGLSFGEKNKAMQLLTSSVMTLFSHVGDTSNLVLDPDMDSYYLMDSVIFKFPELYQNIQEARMIGESVIRRHKITADDKTQLTVLSGLIKSSIDGIALDHQTAFKANAGLKGLLSGQLEQSQSSIKVYLDTIDNMFIRARKDPAGPGKFREAAVDAALNNFRLYDAVSPVVDKLLAKRVGSFSMKKHINVIIASVIFILISYFFAAFYLAVKRSLSVLVEGIEALGKGDLTYRFDIASRDEIGDLRKPLNQMVGNLHELIGKAAETTAIVTSYVADISSAIDQQAAVLSQQSAGVTEITSTMEELSASFSQIADHANTVVEIADGAWDDTKQGSAAVDKLMVKMNEIGGDNQTSITEIMELRRKSGEIGSIMELINSIADQTKLIAFNAALEASSAGEAGKRFGVVAVEIRRLADSVMESTGEISGRVGEIQDAINRLVISSEKGAKGIHEGIEDADRTKAFLSHIVDGSRSTLDAATQISLSTQQQKTASSQVTVALREIASGADHTTSSIREMIIKSKKLAELSDTLRAPVEKFKLKREP